MFPGHRRNRISEPYKQAPVFGEPASDSTVRRALAKLDAKALSRIRRARTGIRAHLWDLLAARTL